MLYELETASGCTLARFTTQRHALDAAYVLSNPSGTPETVLVTCVHLGQQSHRIATLCGGVLLPASR